MKFVLLLNLELLTFATSFLLNIAEHEISLLINIKMLTIVGIFIFISRENFMLGWVEHEKSFIITLGPDLKFTCIFQVHIIAIGNNKSEQQEDRQVDFNTAQTWATREKGIHTSLIYLIYVFTRKFPLLYCKQRVKHGWYDNWNLLNVPVICLLPYSQNGNFWENLILYKVSSKCFKILYAKVSD